MTAWREVDQPDASTGVTVSMLGGCPVERSGNCNSRRDFGTETDA